ncbi:hypothetical protein NT6N_36430 [Oceaniferula spumae]|uniref:Metallo-beta-lactamase domain-containing protein n=1 Tax=Oceaniferula spumae TaxID=2979115 RepID=A0AAT9FRK5_9BACT
MTTTSPNNIPLEDDPCDVIGKAMRGLGINADTLAQETGLSPQDIRQALDGDTDSQLLEPIAHALQLSASALNGLPSYRPEVTEPENLKQIVSSFGHAGVNSFVISQGNKAVVFDTGTDAAPILEFLEKKQLEASALLITHRHPDHTAGIREFSNIPAVYPEDINHGELIQFSDIQLTALDVSGHARPARAFYHTGLSLPVCILGDCMFAGSIGGAPDQGSYQLALQTIRDNILTLPSDTVICPGHGPLSNLHLELEHNPFVAN